VVGLLIVWADSSVNFNVFAPMTATYNLSVAYANGGSTGTYLMTNNGVSAGSVPLPATGGYMSGGWLSGNNPAVTERISTVSVNLNGGWNTIQLNKGVNYGEMDYITLAAVNAGPAAVYAFENNVSDSSGNGNIGTANGSLTFTPGKIGTYAAQFNGANSWVSIPISIGLVDFSMAMWIKTTDASGSSSSDQW